MSVLGLAVEWVGVFGSAFVGARVGRPRRRPAQPEQTARHCICGHLRTSHANKGSGSCRTYIQVHELTCACTVFIPDRQRELDEVEKKLGIGS